MIHDLQAKVQRLGDLDLAVLVSLIAEEHCLFSTSCGTSRDLQEELVSTCTATFGLHPVVVECSPQTTVEQFSEHVLVEPVASSRVTHNLAVDLISREQDRTRASSLSMLDERRIADIIIATDLDLASEAVQVQALELLRTKRIFTRTAMHTSTRDFRMLAIASSPGRRLSHHLNDLLAFSHIHSDPNSPTGPNFSDYEVKCLRASAKSTRYTPEIAAYMHNIVVFMRNSRYIASGVTATATRQLRTLTKALAPLHGLDYVPPSLVALAVRKIYPHRLNLSGPDTEPSMQWGSDVHAVRRMLDGVAVEDAIEDVLATVECPL